MSALKKPRVLVVAVHFTRDRVKRRSRDFMQPMAGLHAASMIDRNRYDVTLYHEMYSGAIDLRAWLARHEKPYDLVMLSGSLQKDFDRMRQLSYAFRRLGAVVVGGGSFCTLYPEFASQFLDVVCSGGVECVRDVLDDYEAGTLRTIYRSPQSRIANAVIDYSLLTENGILGPLHYIEASRGCNFQCDFCSLPAERSSHSVYAVDNVAANIERAIATSPRLSLRRLYPAVWFIDNNFSNNEAHLRAICDYMQKNKTVKMWGALVTQNTLQNADVMRLLAASRCRVLFTGLESLDLEFLKRHNKKQNMQAGIVEQIHEAHKMGILVIYGYLFDPRTTLAEAMEAEVLTLGDAPGLTFPNFFSFVTPLLGTRMFSECVKNGELMPNVRLRDLEGSTVTTRPLDNIGTLSNFARRLMLAPWTMVPYRRMLKKTLRMLPDFRRDLLTSYVVYRNNMRHYDNAKRPAEHTVQRSYIAGMDALDPQYYELPDDLSHEDWSRYFEPIRVTDENGQLAGWLRSEEVPTAAARTLSAMAGAR